MTALRAQALAAGTLPRIYIGVRTTGAQCALSVEGGLHMFDMHLRKADHVRRYTISHSVAAGWEVRLEEDRTVRRYLCYQDWHRVERAVALFQREVLALTAQGWRIAPEET